MSSLTDAVITTDSFKHFRESYNSLRAEFTALSNNNTSNFLGAQEEFRYSVPNLTPLTGINGKFNAFQFDSDVSLTEMNTTTGFLVPSGAVGNVLKFKVNFSAGEKKFLYMSRNTFTLGLLPGQVSDITLNFRHALSGNWPDVLNGYSELQFGLYQTTPTGVDVSKFVGISAQTTGAVNTNTDYYYLKTGLGIADSNSLSLAVNASTWVDIIVRITPTEIFYTVGGTTVVRPSIFAPMSGIPLRLAFRHISDQDTSSLHHYIDRIGYEVTVN